jgi:hypothetical protein
MCDVGNAPCQYNMVYGEVPKNGGHDDGKYHMCAPEAMSISKTP